MGTNYYLHVNECHVCKRTDEPLHIGKSSFGWCFGLHIDPDNGIKDLDDWRALWSKDGAQIKDEYGEAITAKEMEAVITKREGREKNGEPPMGYASWDDFYRRNHADQGPKNLLRHQIDGRLCIGHGKGTWDLLVGDFS